MNSFISWIGGKKALRKKIVEEFPESAECETRWKLESGDTEQKVFKVKGCATGRGSLCNLVV